MPEPTSTTTGAVGLTAVLILLLGSKLGPVLAPVVSEYLLILATALPAQDPKPRTPSVLERAGGTKGK